jgi:hypothetical protein
MYCRETSQELPKKHHECIAVVKATVDTAAMINAQLWAWYEFLI